MFRHHPYPHFGSAYREYLIEYFRRRPGFPLHDLAQVFFAYACPYRYLFLS